MHEYCTVPRFFGRLGAFSARKNDADISGLMRRGNERDDGGGKKGLINEHTRPEDDKDHHRPHYDYFLRGEAIMLNELFI
jgi:hypothetical protein